MRDPLTKQLIRVLVVCALVIVNLLLGALIFVPYEKTHGLRVAFLNVGQGDAILIQGPTGISMLIDGGPDRSVLRELPRIMGPLDRTIDVVVETHPDKDHIAGLTDVFDTYAVSTFMSPHIQNDTDVFKRLEYAVSEEPSLRIVTAQKGMRIHMGGGAYADVLYPDHDVSHLQATNDGSIVLHVVYGTTSFMLTGDLPSTIEDRLVHAEGTHLKSDVLKAGHHGSKYSTDALWLKNVSPQIVVISAGKGNTYGHPAPETMTRIKNIGAQIASTIEDGTIVYESDGTAVARKSLQFWIPAL